MGIRAAAIFLILHSKRIHMIIFSIPVFVVAGLQTDKIASFLFSLVDCRRRRMNIIEILPANKLCERIELACSLSENMQMNC